MGNIKTFIGTIIIGIIIIELCAALEGTLYINWGFVVLPTILGILGIIK